MSGPSRRELLAAAALLPGCAASLADFPFDRALETPGPLGLTLEFYSVTCALLRGPGGAVLCDPFFTHLPLFKLLFGQSVTDPLALRPFRDRLGDVRAVVVGHVHYDHAMVRRHCGQIHHRSCTVQKSDRSRVLPPNLY